MHLFIFSLKTIQRLWNFHFELINMYRFHPGLSWQWLLHSPKACRPASSGTGQVSLFFSSVHPSLQPLTAPAAIPDVFLHHQEKHNNWRNPQYQRRKRQAPLLGVLTEQHVGRIGIMRSSETFKISKAANNHSKSTAYSKWALLRTLAAADTRCEKNAESGSSVHSRRLFDLHRNRFN